MPLFRRWCVASRCVFHEKATHTALKQTLMQRMLATYATAAAYCNIFGGAAKKRTATYTTANWRTAARIIVYQCLPSCNDV